MRKHVLIELGLVLVIIGVCFWNVKQQHETLFLRESIVVLNEEKKELKVKEEELLDENNQLSEQVVTYSKFLKKHQNKNLDIGMDTEFSKEFINIVTKLFEANLNFTPENFEERKQEVSGYLSDDLKEEYFGQNRKTYQDANGTTSKLESLEIYSKEIRKNEFVGVIIVYHRNKQINKEWVSGMNIFKIKYNIKTDKFTEIINLGKGYFGNTTN